LERDENQLRPYTARSDAGPFNPIVITSSARTAVFREAYLESPLLYSLTETAFAFALSVVSQTMEPFGWNYKPAENTVD
jgi:hypothetical protein